jgi:hypothetical protein
LGRLLLPAGRSSRAKSSSKRALARKLAEAAEIKKKRILSPRDFILAFAWGGRVKERGFG